MSTGIGAAVAMKRRNERDASDPRGAVERNQRRALATVLASAIWGGAALIVVTTVAPAAFRVLPTRSLAGALVGQVLPVLFVSGIFVGALCFALVARNAPRALLRRIGAAGVVAGCVVAQLVIGPRIGALRERIGPSVEALAATDPLRLEFGRLHGLSVLSLGVAMLFALLTLIAATLAVRAAPHD
ncbi:MAG TPA: DUF4149 domain-containing protein [Gemmatimonadaceae bacterium]|nr:DUF4149 domain-containing protein [Gemmatimonadaceae bacterium]